MEEYIAAARRELARRSVRNAGLDPDYFAEPAWNMLLDLYIRTVEGRRDILTKEMMIASQVPHTTAKRVVDCLEDAGEIARTKSLLDARSTYIEMTELGRKRLERSLGAMIQAELRIASPHRSAFHFEVAQANSSN